MSYSTPPIPFPTREALRGHLATLDLSWVRGITMHHTGYPDLAMRPQGLTEQHIRNLQDYYRNELRWSAGPHLFVDDQHGAWGLSPLDARGVHAVSFNATHIGIEVLGNYDRDDPSNGRGLYCWRNAAWVVAAILTATGLGVGAINGHRDDPKTSKSCPGSKVGIPWFQAIVSGLLSTPAPKNEATQPADFVTPTMASVKDLSEALDAIEWQLKKLRRLYDA